jgi:hypothetical protein
VAETIASYTLFDLPSASQLPLLHKPVWDPSSFLFGMEEIASLLDQLGFCDWRFGEMITYFYVDMAGNLD